MNLKIDLFSLVVPTRFLGIPNNREIDDTHEIGEVEQIDKSVFLHESLWFSFSKTILFNSSVIHSRAILEFHI